MFKHLRNSETNTVDNTGDNEEQATLGLGALKGIRQLFIQRVPDDSDGDAQLESLRQQSAVYRIFDDERQAIFKAITTSKRRARFFRDLRAFEVVIRDTSTDDLVLRFNRPFRFDCCFCLFYTQTMSIFLNDGAPLGSIKQEWSLCRPRFSFNLPSGELLFHILGPSCTLRCAARELTFVVVTSNMVVPIAYITRQWTGYIDKDYLDLEFFGIEFLEEIDVRLKSVLIAACFLVNALYYHE